MSEVRGQKTEGSLSASLKIGQFNREIDFDLVAFIKNERISNMELRNSFYLII